MNITIKGQFIQLPKKDGKSIYKQYRGKSGKIWLVRVCENPADYIFVEANKGENEAGYRGFRGFGGSTLKFNIEDGEILELRGPWYSNSDAFFRDTGVDIRDKHITYYIIAKSREYTDFKTILVDVIEKDDKPVVGLYYRGTIRAMEVAKELGYSVILYCESAGGSSCGFVYPDQIDVHGNREKKINKGDER